MVNWRAGFITTLVAALQFTAPIATAQETKLYGITWHRSLEAALKAAQSSSTTKPIFVLRMLGDLAGKT
jgi:hypothetical protein